MRSYRRRGQIEPMPPAMASRAADSQQTLWPQLALNASAAPSVARKATVSSPYDAAEQEADAVAESVVAGDTGRAAPPSARGEAGIARKCDACADEEKQEDTIQTKPAAGGQSSGQGAQQAVATAAQGGAPLSETARSYFEPRFGQDFSDVRVHADAQAAEAASGVNARAYTYGSDIVFGAGQYAPESAEGKRLMAHELAHVLQQRGGGESIQRDVDDDVEAAPPAETIDSGASEAEPLDKRGGCRGGSTITRTIRNYTDVDITVPRGCTASINFSALWVPAGESGVDCCTGADTYSVAVNGGTARRLAVGANVCGDTDSHPRGTGTITTRGGRQLIRISVNRNGCDGIAMDLVMTVRIQ